MILARGCSGPRKFWPACAYPNRTGGALNVPVNVLSVFAWAPVLAGCPKTSWIVGSCGVWTCAGRLGGSSTLLSFLAGHPILFFRRTGTGSRCSRSPMSNSSSGCDQPASMASLLPTPSRVLRRLVPGFGVTLYMRSMRGETGVTELLNKWFFAACTPLSASARRSARVVCGLRACGDVGWPRLRPIPRTSSLRHGV